MCSCQYKYNGQATQLQVFVRKKKPSVNEHAFEFVKYCFTPLYFFF